MELEYRPGDEYGHGANPYKPPEADKVISVTVTGTLIVQKGSDEYVHEQIQSAIDDANTQCNGFTRFDYEYEIID